MRCLSFQRSSLIVLGIVLISSGLTGGCGRNTAQEKSYNTQSYNRQNPAATDSGQYSRDVIHGNGPVQTDRDALMGRNQNPNMIVGHSNVRNTQVDLNNMEMMAKSVPGVEGARITLHGGNAYVSLDLKHNVTANQARTIEKQVMDGLRQKLPRYDFHITSNDGYHR